MTDEELKEERRRQAEALYRSGNNPGNEFSDIHQRFMNDHYNREREKSEQERKEREQKDREQRQLAQWQDEQSKRHEAQSRTPRGNSSSENAPCPTNSKRSKKAGSVVKSIITGGIACFFLLGIAKTCSNKSPNDSTEVSATQTTPQTATQPTAKQTAKQTEKSTEKSTTKPTLQPTPVLTPNTTADGGEPPIIKKARLFVGIFLAICVWLASMTLI